LAWTVTLAPAARKSLRAIRDRRLLARIIRALESLEVDPRPAGAKRLVGQEGLMRVRVGDWRILYELKERKVMVLLVRA
jgi:mRNA interferase RelE/StbE